MVDPAGGIAIGGVVIAALARWRHDVAPHVADFGVVRAPRVLARVVRAGDGEVYWWSVVNFAFGAGMVVAGVSSLAGLTDSVAAAVVFLVWPFASIATWLFIEGAGRLRAR